MDRPSSNQGPEASWPWTWPLGGDVTQWIRTSWIKSLSDQTGFININNVRAGDPELERRIIEDVASYGRQLGRMMEALDVVIGHLRLGEGKDLTPMSGTRCRTSRTWSGRCRRLRVTPGRRGSRRPSWTGCLMTSKRSSTKTRPPTSGSLPDSAMSSLTELRGDAAGPAAPPPPG
jgi:hypothetical protein